MRVRKFDTILTKEFLIEQHFAKKKSLYQIGKDVGCNHKTVLNYLNEYGLVANAPNYSGRGNDKHPMWKGYNDISHTYWANLKHGAKTRKIIFELSIEYAWSLYILQQKKCYLSGIDIGFEASKSNTASLDRIDSNKGYIKGNVQWLHRDINFAKQSMTNIQFIEMCRRVITNIG